ncbi:MAG: ATP-binding cassette domain-containing protein, partial [Planctomycetes bacterium]|nr:ATP-binding cassette domain-containing protein [Planctomycetota bacterium]
MNTSPLIRATGLSRIYRRGPQEIRAVDDIHLSIRRGEYLGIVGASGSGKSTILNLLAGLDTPTSGIIE